MMPFTTLLPSPVGHQYYSTFYVLAFALNHGLMLWEGRQRGYPLRTWLLLLAAVTLAFIVGTKLIALPWAEWPALLGGGPWPTSAARSVLGGALASLLALLALRRWLGFDWHVFDAFVVPGSVALAVQCLGCLLTGCCFGEPTGGSWGLHYAPGTLPYLVQQQRGLLPDGAAHSLAVHPTQLYTLAGYVLVGGLLWRLRHRAWPGGSWRLLQLGLLLAARVAIECWRDPAGEQVGAAVREHAGLALKQVQWALLALAPLALAGWWWRVRRGTVRPERVPTNQPLRNLLGVAGLLVFAALLGPGALTLPETLVVKAMLLAVVLLEVGALVHAAARTRRLGLPLALLSGVLLFTNQAPADSTRRAYFSFTPGWVAGRFDEDVTREATSGGCSGAARPAARRGYYHAYAVQGGTFAYTRPSVKTTGQVTYGLGVWGGRQYVNSQQLPLNGPFRPADPRAGQRYALLSINPYIERWRIDPHFIDLGLRLGLHAGQLGYYAPESADSALHSSYVLPDVMGWVGRRRVLFLQGDFGNGPLVLGNPAARVALGSGLGADYGRYLLAGMAVNTFGRHDRMGFLSASFPLGRTGLWLEPYGATSFQRQHQVSVRLQYRLGAGK